MPLYRGASVFARQRQGRPGNSVAFLGDSITLGADLASGDGLDGVTPTVQRGGSFPTYASMLSGGRILYTRNKGIAGQRSDQMLARIQSDVIAYTPDTCIVLAGTNDIAQSVPFATYQGNMKAIVAALRAGGIVPVLCTIPPKATAKATTALWNHWLSRYALSEGITLIDFFGLLTDPATGAYLAAYDSGDGTHPNAAGYYAMGDLVNQRLTPLLPERRPYLCAFDGDTNNLLSGGLFTVDTNADGIGDNWVAYSTPTGGSFTRTRTTDANVPGSMQRVTNTGTTGGLNGVSQPVFAAGKFAPGDKMRLSCVVTSSGIQAEVWVTFTGSTGTTNFKGMLTTQNVTRGVISADFVIPAGTTRFDVALVIQTGTGYAEFGRVGVWNTTALGIS